MYEQRRIFFHPKRSRWRWIGQFVVLIGALWLLFGCAAPTGDWAGTSPKKEVRAQWLGRTIEVRFGPGADRLQPDERRRLAAFVSATLPPPYADRTSVSVVASARDGELARRRIERLRELLSGLRGGPVSLSVQNPRSQPEPDTVVLAAGRFILSVPACPDWSKPAGGDPTNTVSSNFGCANAINLARMIANPADLTTPADPGAADGARAARAVERYRRGEAAELDSLVTSGASQ